MRMYLSCATKKDRQQASVVRAGDSVPSIAFLKLKMHVGGCQNYGLFLDPITAPNI